MTRQLLDNNILIAVFMGGKFKRECLQGIQNRMTNIEIWLPIHGICQINTTDCGKVLHYHNSWDWLMPVVKKIYSLDSYCLYVNETSGQFENKIELTTNINHVYNSVIDFIKWYNNKIEFILK